MFVFAAVPYAVVVLLLAVFQRSLIYHPTRDDSLNIHPARIAGAHIEPIEFTTADKFQLKGWKIIAESVAGKSDDGDAQEPPGRPVILYFCGNAGTREYRVEVFEFIAELGADTICFDYRGFGDNGGSPSESAALADDAQAIWRHVTTERQIDPARIVIFGESLGGGVATRLASELSAAGTPPAGLVLRSTFTRLTDAAAWHFPWVPVRWLLRDRFSSIERIGSVTCPILIFHGRRDTIIPFAQGEELFAAASKQPSQKIANRFVAVETGNHDDVLSAERGAFRAGLHEFLQQIDPRAATRAVP